MSQERLRCLIRSPGVRERAKEKRLLTDWRLWLGAALILPIGVMAVWSAVWSQDHVKSAEAVIDQVHRTAPRSLYPGGPKLFSDQDGLVHFQAQGRTVHARVVLVSGCEEVCDPAYRAGQHLWVYYDPQNLSSAHVGRPDGWPIGRSWLPVLAILGIFGMIFLMTAISAALNQA
jgi:hypothetical protein